MDKVKAKKHLGQHFLNDENIAQKIADALTFEGYKKVLEIILLRNGGKLKLTNTR